MNARAVVMNRISAQVRRFPELDLTPLGTDGLDARDAALALAIEHAAVQHWLTLAHLIQSQLTRPWADVQPGVQAALLVGAAQLLYLDRLPDHAVIYEAVEWAKTNVRSGAGGMVNAVLRKVAGLRGNMIDGLGRTSLGRDELPRNDGRILQLTQSVFDETSVRRLAQQTSHPEQLISRWLAALGENAATQLAQHSLVHAPIIISGVPAAIVENNPLLVPHSHDGFHVFTGDHAALSDLLAHNDRIIVHDPTSAAPILATRDLDPKPRTILDVCAGKGTKTRALARLHPDARIIATDIDRARNAILRAQFAGHPRVSVIEHDQLRDYDGQADMLVLDVPCSNSGVLARRVEAKYRLDRQSLEKLVKLQWQIIADSILLLSPRGKLLYCTCSIDAMENEQQAQWIAKWHRLKIAASASRLPNGLPGESPTEYCDGGYWALLAR